MERPARRAGDSQPCGPTPQGFAGPERSGPDAGSRQSIFPVRPMALES